MCSSPHINHHQCHAVGSIKRLIEDYCYNTLGTFFDKETPPVTRHSILSSTVRLNSLPTPIQVAAFEHQKNWLLQGVTLIAALNGAPAYKLGWLDHPHHLGRVDDGSMHPGAAVLLT